MELKLDPEFEELIPPLTLEEYEGLEQSILENGYDQKKPIITWNNTIVDGHNRYAICGKHNIEFTTSEQEFPSRSAAKIWMIDEQTKRRNINEMTRAYLVGTRYKEEKKEQGNSSESIKERVNMHNAQSLDDKSTVQKIAEHAKVNPSTVQRAEKFANALNTVVAVTGIKRSSILSGLLKSTMRDIVTLASLSPENQSRVIAKVQDGEETDIKNGTLKVQREERDKAIKEEQERKKKEQKELKEKQEKERKEKEEKLKVKQAEDKLKAEEKLKKQQEEERKEEEEKLKVKQASEEELRKQQEELKEAQRQELIKQEEDLKNKQAEELKKQQEDLEKQQEEELKKQQDNEEKDEEERRVLELNSMRYSVILCDPPWEYDFSETKSRDIENQYPTMKLNEIKSLEIPADDDTVLFLWATAPKLEQAFEVLKAWGFTYKTCAVWDKEIIGMGYWFRGQHELLLVATKGKPIIPTSDNRYSSVIRERRTAHSKKPDCVYSMIEKMIPSSRYLEMFARNTRENWYSWGNQV